jgi:hypothetical protein
MALGMQVPHFIPNMLTKWHIQFLLILVVIQFLSPEMFEFKYFIPACSRTQF